MAMSTDTTTIQVRRATAGRLKALKAAGLSYDEVITFLLDRLDEEDVQMLVRDWQDQALAALKDHPDVTVE